MSSAYENQLTESLYLSRCVSVSFIKVYPSSDLCGTLFLNAVKKSLTMKQSVKLSTKEHLSEWTVNEFNIKIITRVISDLKWKIGL